MKHYLSILFILLLLVACDPAAELGTPFHKVSPTLDATALPSAPCMTITPNNNWLLSTKITFKTLKTLSTAQPTITL